MDMNIDLDMDMADSNRSNQTTRVSQTCHFFPSATWPSIISRVDSLSLFLFFLSRLLSLFNPEPEGLASCGLGLASLHVNPDYYSGPRVLAPTPTRKSLGKY